MEFLLIVIVLSILSSVLSQSFKWMDSNLKPIDRANALLFEMTTEEKIVLLHGTSDEADVPYTGYVGYVSGNERLKIPALKLNDGPQGFRVNEYPGTSTCFPSLMTVGITWDRGLCREFGEKMAEEFKGKGANVLLGPGLNLQRIPKNGRNFEYLSGADPYLGYVLVQDVVKGIQSKGIIANAKHWIENNQEKNRLTVSATVDERTRFELYYKPFIGAIEADVGSFMCSYNKINSDWSCENNVTLNHDLKEVLGYKNFVMSDWEATHSCSINKGLDMEMPGSVYMGAQLADGVDKGEIDISFVDQSVMRILSPMFSIGLFDYVNNNTLDNNVVSDSHNRFARTLSASSHVLLKNDDNVLPLSKNKSKKIAIFGRSAIEPVISGGGSGAVFPSYVVSPYEGIAKALGIHLPDASYSCDTNTLTKNAQIKQYGCQSVPSETVEDCAIQCGKFYNCHAFSFESGQCLLSPTMNEVHYSKGGVVGECTKSSPSSEWQCNNDGVCISFHDGQDLVSAAALAKEADVNIVAISQFAKEGSDRDNLSFDVKLSQTCQVTPLNQNQLVTTVAATEKATVVAATAPGPVLLPWRDSVSAIVIGFMPGQEYGNALADVIFGIVNPAAKLTFTIPNIENEVGFSFIQYPGIPIIDEEIYSERSKIDYRWYTSNNVTPAYSFGHGLSYTTFDYSDLSIVNSKVTVTVKNSGNVNGAEVVQLYVQFPELARTPPLQLKGFHKTSLIKPNESETIEFVLSRSELSIWDIITHSFIVIPGTYDIKIGASSADIRLKGSLHII